MASRNGMVIKVATWAAFTRMWQDRQTLPAAPFKLIRSPDRHREQELTGGVVAQP
jgi:hypothetical protein